VTRVVSKAADYQLSGLYEIYLPGLQMPLDPDIALQPVAHFDLEEN